MTKAISGAAVVINTLVSLGVDTIFGYPGGAVLPFYDELFKHNAESKKKIRHILVRHEQSAVHAAEGYARSTGKVGVVVVTSGPGATNTITGLTDALLDSIPVVCLTGQVPTHLIGSDAFQEADTVGITQSCTKHNYLVKNENDLKATVCEAFYIANTGRPGPVVIDIPKNVQLAMVECKDGCGCSSKCDTTRIIHRKSYKPALEGDEAAIKKAVDLLATAERPIFYTGGGIINSGPEASKLLTEFVRMTGAPITNTLMGFGGYPANDKQYLGMLGMHGTYEANMAMARCDVMVCIGARFDDRITGRIDAFSVGSKKIHVDIDASSINKNIEVDIPVIGDAAHVLKRMIALWKENKYSLDKKAADSWWKQLEKWRSIKSLAYVQNGDLIKPQYVIDTLNTAIKDRDAYITTDVGQHQMWAAQYLKFDKPKHWMTSGGLGTMGYGFPAAIGVQVAHPKASVICVTGDSSFMMKMQELSTIVQYRLPVKILIMNNMFMGMVRQWQELFHGTRYSESYMESLPDFVKLGESFGISGVCIKKPTDVEATINKMLDTKGPFIVDMRIERCENVYPMIPGGAAHYEMKLNPDQKIELDEEEAALQM